jgi:hypothetical protein
VGLELCLVSTVEELLESKVVASVYRTEIMAIEDPLCLCDIPLSAKVGTNFADK